MRSLINPISFHGLSTFFDGQYSKATAGKIILLSQQLSTSLQIFLNKCLRVPVCSARNMFSCFLTADSHVGNTTTAQKLGKTRKEACQSCSSPKAFNTEVSFHISIPIWQLFSPFLSKDMCHWESHSRPSPTGTAKLTQAWCTKLPTLTWVTVPALQTCFLPQQRGSTTKKKKQTRKKQNQNREQVCL